MKQIFIFLFILNLFSCSDTNKSNENEKVLAPKIDSQIINVEQNFDYSNTIFKSNYTDSSWHHFSNMESKDVFLIFIPEGNINKTESYLRIIQSDSNIIYEKKFSTADLINGYSLYKIKNDEELISEIVNRVKDNLDDSSFVNLNSDENTLFSNSSKSEFENYEVYLECKADNRPVYSFGLNEENISYFGFSKKINKVVPVFYCC